MGLSHVLVLSDVVPILLTVPLGCPVHTPGCVIWTFHHRGVEALANASNYILMRRYNSRATLGIRGAFKAPSGIVYSHKSVIARQISVSKLPMIRSRFFQKRLRGFTDAPYANLASFIFLYEFSGLVPFVGIWYALHNYDLGYFSSGVVLPEWMLVKGTETVDKLLHSTNLIESFSIADTTKLVLDGSKSFAISQLLFPLRAVFALFTMDSFTRRVILPLKGLFKKKEVKKLDQEVKYKKLTKKRL